MTVVLREEEPTRKLLLRSDRTLRSVPSDQGRHSFFPIQHQVCVGDSQIRQVLSHDRPEGRNPANGQQIAFEIVQQLLLTVALIGVLVGDQILNRQ